MYDRRVRFSALSNLCQLFARRLGAPLSGEAGVGRAILPWALCLVVAAEGCPQTRLPNLVPTPYDADKRSFNVHDPLPETDIGPDTGARPPGFLQERSEPRRTQECPGTLGRSARRHEQRSPGPAGGTAGRHQPVRPASFIRTLCRSSTSVASTICLRAVRWCVNEPPALRRRSAAQDAERCSKTAGVNPAARRESAAWASRLRTALVAVCVLALLASDVSTRLCRSEDRPVDRGGGQGPCHARDAAGDRRGAGLSGRAAGLARRLVWNSRQQPPPRGGDRACRHGVSVFRQHAGPRQVRRQVQKAVDFLLSRFQPNGFIFDEGNTGHGPMYDHGFATLFLAEVYGMTRTPRVRNSLERAVQLIINSQNKEGGWRYEPDSKDADLSVTICQIMALRARGTRGSSSPKRRSIAAPNTCASARRPKGASAISSPRCGR